MRRSQTILEVTLIFIIGLFLFFGIMGMWMWGDNQIAKRQPEYNQTRVQAGTVKDSPVSSGGGALLTTLIAQRDDLEAQLASLRISIADSIAQLEASKSPFQTELNQYEAEKALLEAERAALEAERAVLQPELAQLLKTCNMSCGDNGCSPCVDRIEAIRSRLSIIGARIAVINDRVDNYLTPEINRLQAIIDQIDIEIAVIENDIEPAADLEKQIADLNALIAELENTENNDPEAKDLYWPVYEPDELTEEDVFGGQD